MAIVKPTGAGSLTQVFRSEVMVSDAGQVPSGFTVASFYNTGATAITIGVQTIPANSSKTLSDVKGRQFAEPVLYDATGGTLLIEVLW